MQSLRAEPLQWEAHGALPIENYGRATLADLFDDWVVYRNLEPLDKRVPGFKNSSYLMGISDDHIPRKQEIEYAKAATWIIQKAQTVRGQRRPTAELLFLGDTLFNDGQAFRNMATVTGWRGACFIGADRTEHEPSSSVEDNGLITNANRWAALAPWLAGVHGSGLHLDERTAVVVDIDKTALGAKGRNDHVIDRARLEGIFRTMTAVLGEDRFDKPLFVEQYNELNRGKYHFLTADNQDYLTYICLVLNAGMVSFNELMAEIDSSSMENFDQFIRWVDSRMMLNDAGSETLLEVHEAVLSSVRAGDPTPFKRFRRQEFICTVEHMGNMADNTPVKELLGGEITLTEEVWQVAAWLKQRGCFLLCLSDKPDEASAPSKGYTAEHPPIHRAPTHRVGADLSNMLAAIA
jgi:hypothetical protein